MLGKIESGERRGWQRTRWLDGVTDSGDTSLSRLREFSMDREAWRAEVHVVTKSWTWLSDWTELIGHLCLLLISYLLVYLTIFCHFDWGIQRYIEMTHSGKMSDAPKVSLIFFSEWNGIFSQACLSIPSSLVKLRIFYEPIDHKESACNAGTQVWSLGQADPLEEGPTPVLLPGEFHGQRSLGRLQFMELQRFRHNWATSTPLSLTRHLTVCYPTVGPWPPLS